VNARALVIGSALGFAASAFALSRSAVAERPAADARVPYYDTRDFTPRWSPVSHRVASFSFIDQNDRIFGDRDLEGKIHVASFIFTSCPAICPTLVGRLKPVQDAMRGAKDVTMVSFSVTPMTDTPSVLAEFGALRGIDPSVWHLLTGDPREIERVMKDSYFANDDRTLGDPGGDRLLHSEKVLLVDRDRRLRGIYNGTSAFEMERLIEDIDALRKEK